LICALWSTFTSKSSIFSQSIDNADIPDKVLPKAASDVNDMRRKPPNERIDGFREVMDCLCMGMGESECLGLGAGK
jgi:hypothetical protein